MSGFSFSTQFRQRWSQIPDTVRVAIYQELDDIVTLLNPDVDLADFKFSQSNLTAHIEALYLQDAKQKLRASMTAVMPKPIKLACQSDGEQDDFGLSDKQKKLIQSLEMSIDDYLAETLSLISKDLKAWVTEEVKRQGST